MGVYREAFTLELRKIFAYRADFWVQYIGGVAVQVCVAWFLWKSIFAHAPEAAIGGYTFPAMMTYYLLAPLIASAVEGADFGWLSDEIYEGTLSRYILYPMSLFAYKFMVNLAHTALFLAQGFAVLALCEVFLAESDTFHITLQSLFMSMTVVLFAALLHFVLEALIEQTAFWADNVWSLLAISRFISALLGGALLPLSLFPDTLRTALHLLPFAYFVNVPVQCLTGRIVFSQWLASLGVIAVWIVLLSLLYGIVWNRGKYHYTGVGI
jgi:ABC-2 type transport system permease protein